MVFALTDFSTFSMYLRSSTEYSSDVNAFSSSRIPPSFPMETIRKSRAAISRVAIHGS